MNLNRLFQLGACLLLAACAATPQSGESPSNTSLIESLDEWALEGRLAVSDGKDGGSGRLQWRHSQQKSMLDFRGAFGKGAWQMSIEPDLATLIFADGGTWQATDVSTLVKDHVGWNVPVESLSWWVRGLPAPGDLEHRELDENGRMALLSQNGWDVEYKKYKVFSGFVLPTRLDARSGDRHVKLVMRDWTIPADSGNEH